MNITQALHRAAAQTPELPATIFGDRVRSWAQCRDRVARLAGALRGLGVSADDRVGILSLNSDRYHEILLAVPWAGGVVNPVNTRWSVREIAFSLVDSGTRILFVDDAFAGALPELSREGDPLAWVVYCGEGDAPVGTLRYEDLIAGAEPIEDAHRHAQGRHAQPPRHGHLSARVRRGR